MDVTAIKENGVIDTPFEVLIIILLAFFGIIILFKIGNFIESMPVAEPKKRAVKEVKKDIKKEVKKDIKKDTKKDIKKSVVTEIDEKYLDKEKVLSIETSSKELDPAVLNSMSAEASSCSSYVCPYASMHSMPQNNAMYMGYSATCDNYLHDRFAVSPTSIDYVEDRKISKDFLSDEELSDINRNVDIKVKEKEPSSREKLHNRISEMTSHNKETRERLLDEFEGLSREMKLLIIENIIQKM